GTTDRNPTRNPAQSAATILGPPRCRRMATSVVAVERCCSADRRQGHTEVEPRRVSASPTPARSPTTRWLLAAYGRIAELAHRAGRPRSRSAKRAKPSTPSPQLLNPGAVEHHGLLRAASRASPLARERRSKQVNEGASMDLCSYYPLHIMFASRPTISMGPEPIDHTVHD